MPRRLYRDSCAFLGLINPDEAKHADCRAVWEEARRGDAILYTSFFAFAEVFKAKCEGPAKPLAEAQDRQIAALLRQRWVEPLLVDERIGTAARRLMRQHPECKKPSDAIHLATALAANVDEMHTYDKSDLLGLDEKVMRTDGVPLKICTAYVMQPPLPLPIPSGPVMIQQGVLSLETPKDASAEVADTEGRPENEIPEPSDSARENDPVDAMANAEEKEKEVTVIEPREVSDANHEADQKN